MASNTTLGHRLRVCAFSVAAMFTLPAHAADSAVQSAAQQADSVRASMAAYFRAVGEWPRSNADLFLPEPSAYQSSVLSSLTVLPDSELLLVLPSSNGTTRSLTYYADDATLSWTCLSSDMPDVADSLPGCVYQPAAANSDLTEARLKDALDALGVARVELTAYYAEHGEWPATNAAAGLDAPADYKTATLALLTVEGEGAVRAQLVSADDASESLRYIGRANAAGNVSWRCTSPDVVTIADVLPNCVYLADGADTRSLFSASRDAVGTEKYADAFNALAGVRTRLAEYYATNGAWPSSNADANLPAPAAYATSTVLSVTVYGEGWLVAKLANTRGALERIVLQGDINSLGRASWRCTSPDIATIAADTAASCTYQR